MDRREVDRFIMAEYDSLLGAIRRKLNLDEVSSLDLAHEAIMRIYDSLDNYDPAKGTLGMWFSGILRNLILQYREGRMRPFLLDGDMEEKHAAPKGPTGEAVSQEIGDFVLKSVESLPEIYRDTVRMRYIEGLDLKEIAKRLKVPLGTVKARLSRSPAMLKDALNIQETTARFYLEQLKKKQS